MKKTITTIILITFCLAKVQAQNVELPTAMTVEINSYWDITDILKRNLITSDFHLQASVFGLPT